MLYKFVFKNFKSYKNETIFDMRAENIDEFEDSIIITESKERLLPVSAIYGPNAGGKSGLIEALVCLTSIVMKPKIILEYNDNKSKRGSFTLYNNECEPYKFDNVSIKKPTEFEIYFATNKNEYKYSISLLNGKIITESLYKKGFNAKKPAKIFIREQNNVVPGNLLKKDSVAINVNEIMPYLTFLSITTKIEVIEDVINWFQNIEALNYANEKFEKIIKLCSNNEKSLLLSMMNGMDIDIYDYRIEEKEGKEGKKDIEVYTKHKKENKEYELNFDEESQGTKKIFSLIPHIIYNLLTGGVILIDELDAKLHPKLLRYIILLYKDKNINKNNAQMIFTSQDLTTMNNQIFRRDEIWFACRNDNLESEIYSLYDIRDEKGEHIRANAPYNKQYISGKYGADPFLKKMLGWEV